MYQVKYKPQFLADYQSFLTNVTTPKKNHRAWTAKGLKKFKQALETALIGLQEFPHYASHPLIPELRHLVVWNQIIFFEIKEKQKIVLVYRLLPGKIDLARAEFA